MTGYVPPTYEFFTFRIYFCTQTHLHIPTYFITTSNNTRYKKSKYRIFTPKFTTLWTTDTYKLNQHFRHTISGYTSTAQLYIHNHNHLLPYKCITHHQNPINHKTNNLHLLRPTLAHLPSLPFQM